MLISVIVATYNRPDALAAVLSGLREQTDSSFEVVVADDGSGPATRAVATSFPSIGGQPVVHVWHEDQGFRLAAIRNRAAVRARGDYLIFIDGDCIPRPDFVARHRALAEPGWMVAGNRVLLAEKFSRDVLEHAIAIQQWSMRDWLQARRRGHINRAGPLTHLPLGALRKLGSKRWQRVRGCNMGVWKSDLFKVNGFEEAFEGWGHEDSDFAVRLVNAEVGLKKGAYATALLHLWHRENDRRVADENWQRLQQRVASRDVRAAQGLDRYLTEAVTDS